MRPLSFLEILPGFPNFAFDGGAYRRAACRFCTLTVFLRPESHQREQQSQRCHCGEFHLVPLIAGKVTAESLFGDPPLLNSC